LLVTLLPLLQKPVSTLMHCLLCQLLLLPLLHTHL
jgi:hypothetical protein